MSLQPPRPPDVFLMPGDFHFGAAPLRIATLLGSCVSIALWHPLRRIGGMCHYLLPSGTVRPDTRPGAYADLAMNWLLKELSRAGSHPVEYQASLVGGGNMFPGLRRAPGTEVGERNIAAGRALLAKHGFSLHLDDTGGAGHRHVELDLATGRISVRFERQGTAVRTPAP